MKKYFLSLIIFFAFAGYAKADFWQSDNFNSYSVGDYATSTGLIFNEQDYNTYGIDGFEITNSGCKTGNCLYHPKTHTKLSSIYASTTECLPERGEFWFKFDNTPTTGFGFSFGSKYEHWDLYLTKGLYLKDIYASTSLGYFGINNWNKIEWQIYTEEGQIRVKLNDNIWSDWHDYNSLNCFNKVELDNNIETNSNYFIDDFYAGTELRTDQIWFTYLNNGKRYTDFNRWTVSYIPDGTNASYRIDVNYGTTSLNYIYRDSDIMATGSTLSIISEIADDFPKSQKLYDGQTIYLEARLYKNNVEVASTSELNFLVDFTGGGIPGSTENAVAGLDNQANYCIDVDNTFGMATLCSVFVKLFIPKVSIETYINDFIDDFRYIPVFSWFFDVKDIIIEENANFYDTGEGYLPRNTNFEDLLYNHIRQAFIVILWLIFTFYVIKKIIKTATHQSK